MSQAVKAENFYKANAGQEKAYVAVYVARPVKAGATVEISNSAFGPAQVRAGSDGYQVSTYRDLRNSYKVFVDTAAFAKDYAPADQLAPIVDKEEISEEKMVMKPVARGGTLVIDTVLGIAAQVSAPSDGFAVTTDGGERLFLSNYELSAMFNYAGRKSQSTPDTLVCDKGAPLMKGIILQKDTVFDFKAGEYKAPAGSFLYANPDDEDGYTVLPPAFVALGLRKNPFDVPTGGPALDKPMTVSNVPLRLKKRAP